MKPFRSLSAMLRRPRSRSADPAGRSQDPRRGKGTDAVRHAAIRAAEPLEARILMTGLPASVHASADAAYAVSGGTLSVTAGTLTFDANIASEGADWQNL